MSWGNCGTDSNGRQIGYIFDTICDHPECNEKIDRGLAYACGGMHGEDIYSCEKYFCDKHLYLVENPEGYLINICNDCRELMKWTE